MKIMNEQTKKALQNEMLARGSCLPFHFENEHELRERLLGRQETRRTAAHRLSSCSTVGCTDELHDGTVGSLVTAEESIKYRHQQSARHHHH